MRHYPKIKTQQRAIDAAQDEVVVSDISIARLIEDGLLVLFREIKNLKALSVNGKLPPNDARDLRDHLKLLFELKDREKGLLDTMSDEELEKLAKDDKDDNQ